MNSSWKHRGNTTGGVMKASRTALARVVLFGRSLISHQSQSVHGREKYLVSLTSGFNGIFEFI
jgi:hypothetical protein